MELFQELMEDPTAVIDRMSPFTRSFLADAVDEYPPFLEEYLVPVLCSYECPEEKIIHDLSGAVQYCELEEIGLAGYEDLTGLGELAGVLKKIKKAVKKVAHKVIAPVKKVIEKVTPKPILNIQKKVAGGFKKVAQAQQRIEAKVQKVEGKIGKKYGDTIITAAGAVLAPFTGGASLAAAAALVAAHKAYTAKRAADQAKKLAKSDAAQVQQAADQAQSAASQQLDDFYRQNQAWFISRGITPEQWAAMSFDQKVAAINSASQAAGSQPPQSGGGSAGGSMPDGGGSMPSGGGGMPTSGGGGGGGGGGGDSAQYGPAPGQPAQKVATAGMFDSSMLPILAVGAGLALIFGKPEKGRRTRRNPRRRRVA